MKHICIFLIQLYQKYLSPLLGPHCRFTPTCSQYAVLAFRRHGFWKGAVLSLWRILRCNPFGKAGFDPVPEQFPKRKEK
ncbi:MAG: membrane protein insertion efficiency factor YidD [Clostridia bacterium]|nr:membrane protein insertion efficiency factor YidD [Clostridia bacterium]